VQKETFIVKNFALFSFYLQCVESDNVACACIEKRPYTESKYALDHCVFDPQTQTDYFGLFISHSWCFFYLDTKDSVQELWTMRVP